MEARGASGFAICRGNFRGSHGGYVGSFYALLGVKHAIYAKVMGIIFAIEYAQLKDFKKVLLECGFYLLCFVNLLVGLTTFFRLLKIDDVSVCKFVLL